MTISLTVFACGGSEDGPPEGYAVYDVFGTTRPGYTIAYREDWAVEEVRGTGRFSSDLFTDPDGTTVEISCESEQARTGTDPFTQLNVNRLKSEGIAVTVEEKTEIVGSDKQILAGLITYSDADKDYARVMNSDLNCGWTITLTTPHGARDEYMDVLKTMAATFERY